MADNDRPAWLTKRREVVVITSRGSDVVAAETTTIDRILKRDIVLADGTRFTHADLRAGVDGESVYRQTMAVFYPATHTVLAAADGPTAIAAMEEITARVATATSAPQRSRPAMHQLAPIGLADGKTFNYTQVWDIENPDNHTIDIGAADSGMAADQVRAHWVHDGREWTPPEITVTGRISGILPADVIAPRETLTVTDLADLPAALASVIAAVEPHRYLPTAETVPAIAVPATPVALHVDGTAPVGLTAASTTFITIFAVDNPDQATLEVGGSETDIIPERVYVAWSYNHRNGQGWHMEPPAVSGRGILPGRPDGPGFGASVRVPEIIDLPPDMWAGVAAAVPHDPDQPDPITRMVNPARTAAGATITNAGTGHAQLAPELPPANEAGDGAAVGL